MPACPHCSQDLGSGFVDQKTLQDRLNAKEAKNKELAAEVGALRTKADAHDQLAAELAKERAAREAAETRQARTAELAKSGVTDPAAHKRIDRLFDLYRDETGDGALDYAGWLAGPAREDVLLAPFFRGVAAPGTAAAPAAPAAQPAAPRAPLPAVNTGAAPAPAPVKISAADAQRIYSAKAEELRRTEPDRSKRDAALAQLKADLGQQLAAATKPAA